MYICTHTYIQARIIMCLELPLLGGAAWAGSPGKGAAAQAGPGQGAARPWQSNICLHVYVCIYIYICYMYMCIYIYISITDNI